MLRSFNPTFAPINPIDIDGGTIDGTTIGASVPSTGAFTTLSASGNVSVDGGSFVFNDAGADKDARFEGDSDANLLFTDASTDFVGIGTSTPAVKLHAIGNVRSTGSGNSYAQLSGGNADGANLQLNRAGSASQNAFFGQFQGALLIKNLDSGATLFTNTTSDTERMRITAAGNVGIGASSPANLLQVNGSIGRTAPVTKTGNFTLANTENWVICNGSGSITVTLPAASSWAAREVMIKTIAAQTVVSASSNVVPVDGSVAGTAILAATAGKWATLVSDGTNWIIMAAN